MIWTNQQEAALKAVSTWLKDKNGKQVFRLFGYGGTGKTSLAKHLAKDVRKVIYGSFTGKAALVMRKNGCIGASTIHSMIYKTRENDDGSYDFSINHDSAAVDADLIIIDEVSMVYPALGKDLEGFGTKILVLGDPGQLPPVNGETGYFTAQEPDILLTEIHRQALDNPIIRLSMDVREGRGLKFGTYGESKVIRSSEVDRDEMLSYDQILVGMNKSRRTYNERIRNIKGFPAETPVVNDKVICLKNDSDVGLLNGQIFSVSRVTLLKWPAIQMRVKAEDGTLAAVDVKAHMSLFNGDPNDINFKELRAYKQFDYSYCISTHKAQGSQFGSVFIFNESRVFKDQAQRWLYTAISRAIDKVTIVGI